MYGKLDNSILIELIRLIDNIPEDIEGDVFGKIYEYFILYFYFKYIILLHNILIKYL